MDIIAALITWTVTHSGYAEPPEAPRIEYLPTSAFIEQVCPQHAQCTVKGYYADGSQTIVLHDSLRDLKQKRQARAMLVHEIVHYLQYQSGRWGPKTCQSWIEREREAYRVQLRYLAEQGVHPSRLLMPPFDVTQCQAESPDLAQP